MKDKYQHRTHNKNLLMVHIILATKYRKKLLFDDFRIYIKQLLLEICVTHHWYVKRIETGKDHIHILLQYNPTDSITQIVSSLKQESTYHAWKLFYPMLRQHYWKERTLWSDGYFAASVGTVSMSVIEQYIANQG
jgi:putative transposase